jgi:hypothetical protein
LGRVIRDDLPPFEDTTASYEPLYPPASYAPSPPRGPVLGSALRYWYLVLLPMLALAGAAVAIGLQRSPTYKAETRLNVGGFNISAQSLPGFAGGAYLLSNAYSRAAYADSVLDPVAKKSGRTKAQIASAITASPVKDSPIIRVEAEANSAGLAVLIANLTAKNLQRHAVELARSNPDSRRLFKDFKRASHGYREAVLRWQRAHRRHRGEDSADTNLELARLRKNSTASLYQTSLGGQATTNAVQILSPARGATSDRRAVLERLLAAGLLGGFAIGVGLAYLFGRNRIPGRIRA